MRALVRSLAPTDFGDVAALVALYRPGPMAANMHNDYADRKNGRKPITYLHPDMAEVLSDTYGLMIYQESMLRVAQRFAGYTLAEADNLRKAAGKKVREIMAQEREKFVAGCEAPATGAPSGPPVRHHRALRRLRLRQEPRLRLRPGQLPDGVAQGQPPRRVPGLPAHQRQGRQGQDGGLPGRVPVRWASRSSSPTSTSRRPTSPPCAPARDGHGHQGERPGTGPGRGVVPFGLSAIRNVGEGLVERIVSEREADGPFTDFYDFCPRVDPVVLNKRTVESLIKAGAFDSLGHPRQGLCLVFEQVVDRTLARRREADQGVMSLFGGPGGGGQIFDDARVPVPDQEFDKHTKLVVREGDARPLRERPPSGGGRGGPAPPRRLHDPRPAGGERGPGSGASATTVAPTAARPAAVAMAAVAAVAAAGGGWNGDRWVGGVVTGLTRKYTKRGELMATFVLEDLESSIEVLVFPRTMTEVGHLLADDAVVCVKGRLDLRDDVPKLVCSEVKRPQLSPDGAEPLHLVVVPVTPSTTTGSRACGSC